jgi:hypothetical protein
MTRINVTNTVVTEVAVRNVYVGGGVGVVYANRVVPGAVVAVRGEALVGGRPVAAIAVRVPPGAVERAEVIHAALVAPERAAVLGGRAPLAGPHVPPAAVANRRVVAKMAPPPAPVPFARQQEALRANPGKPLDAGATRSLQAGQPAAPANVRVNAAPARTSVEATPLNNRQNVAPATTAAPRPEARPEPAAAPHANPPAAKPEEHAQKKTSKTSKKTTRTEKDK